MDNHRARKPICLAFTAAFVLGVPTLAMADEPTPASPPAASTAVPQTLPATPSTAVAQAPAAAPAASSEVDTTPPPPSPLGRSLLGSPPSPYGWTTSSFDEPLGYKPPMRRDKAMAAAGGVVMGTGLLTTVAGMFVGLKNIDCHTVFIFPSCQAHDQGVARAAEGMMIGGLVTLVVGIPILVVGLKKRPVPGALGSLAGEPAPSGWAWRF